MKYVISDIYIRVDNYDFIVGVVLGEEDDKYSVMPTEYLTNTEFKVRLINNTVSDTRYMNDLVYHSVGEIISNVSKNYIKKKWFDELSLIIDTSEIINKRMYNIDLNELINKIHNCYTTEVSVDKNKTDTETFVNLEEVLKVINELDRGE